MNGDTIAAPATAPGRGALAVVRISGPATGALVEARLGRALPDRRAVLVAWKDAAGRELDSAVATFFAGPRSYTGEDSLELSLHGNPLIVQAVLEDLHAAGVRLAQPGEFTRRAVENGRLGLVEAESVALLVAAETRSALRNAQRILSGELRGRVEALRAALLELSVRLELSVDFAEEDLSPEETGVELAPLRTAAGEALAALDALLASHARASRRSIAPRAVFVGRPNAGKSSLINALLGEERLIVSPIAGTTRDWVEAPLLLPRGAIHLVDTAGLGDPRDALDALAQERSRAVLDTAHLAILVAEAGRPLEAAERALLAARPDEAWLVVRTKADIASDGGEGTIAADTGEPPALAVSARAGTGLEALERRLAERLLAEGDEDEPPAVATERQRQAVEAARERLAACREALTAGAVEIAAHEARGAIGALRELVGELPPETVLDRVFSSFCIGK